MADGMAARRIATMLLWDVQAAAPGRATAHAPHEQRVRHGLADVPRLSAVIERELAPATRRSELARRVHADRAVAFASVPLDGLLAMRDVDGLHVTVNDLVLAGVAGGLRRWLVGRGAPLHSMRVKVPVSMHRPGEAADPLGNDDSFFFVMLPLAQPDPVTRLTLICLDCTKRKHDADAVELGTLLHSAAALSPSLGRRVVRWSMSPRVFTLNVSNVPGPRGTVRVLDRPVQAVYALAEVADWHALRVAVFSAAGQLTFGLCADADEVPALATIARGIEEELADLRACVPSPSVS
jgi:WS/DGAT/MGAT family acyltransferase